MPYQLNDLWEFDHPDLSSFVIHFTGRVGSRTPGVPTEILNLTATTRLEAIFSERRILAYPMFQTPDPVVCFSECTRAAVEKLVRQGRYSAWGIGFRKNMIFKRGGGPAFYVRGDQFELVDNLPPQIRSLCTRFWPGVTWEGDGSWRTSDSFVDSVSQWIHEREWRVLGDGEPPAFQFSFEEISFTVTPSPTDHGEMRASISRDSPELLEAFDSVPAVHISPRGTIDDPSRIWIR